MILNNKKFKILKITISNRNMSCGIGGLIFCSFNILRKYNSV